MLDISKIAIERSRNIIPNAKVCWMEGDILAHESIPDIDIWHDRAVFHFLTDKKDIKK